MGDSFSQRPYRDFCGRLSSAVDGGSFQTLEVELEDIDSSPVSGILLDDWTE